ncbi:MAG TPA: methyl-accepting chemotaxis protein [Myxococcaceae bacterium]|nr:methyl-accepting chemotaxis protein [Myxococcaceae bacterium]
MRRRFIGLLPKLLAMMAVAIILVASAMTWQAAQVMGQQMSLAFESKGKAIALSLAAAQEGRAEASLTLTQSLVDSNKTLDGVAYIYLEDAEGAVEVHTFSPAFPPSLHGRNKVELGELTGKERVKYDREAELVLELPDGSRRELSATDIAAPISGGALGVVHVGMDRGLIDAQVGTLRARMLWLGLGAALVGIAAALFLVLVVVVRPVRELTRVTSDIVSKGDLTQTIQITSSDEIGQLAATFTKMVEKLRQIPLALSESIAILAGAVTNLNSSTTEQGQTLNRQATALQETQVTAQEIKQTSLVAAQKADAVLQVAERADAISQSGEAAIEQSLSGMTDLRQRVEEISQKIVQLSERTLQIGGITQTVKDLADQSNMLALNAAIEAVRSGEHGKGFAVVAREIRSLADQSIKATERVREILDDISTAIRSAVVSSEKGAARMEAGLVQVRTSGENLKELSNIVRDNSLAVRQIAAAVNQQNAGITQIFTAVTDLSKMMDESISRLTSTNEAASTLREVADRVQQMVKSYRV